MDKMNKQRLECLRGVIDMHVHTAPDVITRTYTDIQLTDAAVRSGARAIVIKGHHCATMTRAALCNEYKQQVYPADRSFIMFGGLVLNYEVGGLNVKAVETALKLGAKVIWLPTVDAANEYQKRGKNGGIRMLDNTGSLVPQLLRIFELIRDHHAVLATGHISPDEILRVVEGARKVGVQKIVITHPEYWIVDLSPEQQERLMRESHVVMERCFRQPLANGEWVSNAETNLDAIRKFGVDHTILSTDCGNPANPPWEEAMAQYLHFLVRNGVRSDAIQKMTRELPARLLDLDEAESRNP